MSAVIVSSSRSTLTLVSVSPLSSQAEGFKEQGNAFYSKKDYSEAFNYYTKAIGEITTNYSLSGYFKHP